LNLEPPFMQERRSVKKLLAYEKEVNEGFAKTA